MIGVVVAVAKLDGKDHNFHMVPEDCNSYFLLPKMAPLLLLVTMLKLHLKLYLKLMNVQVLCYMYVSFLVSFLNISNSLEKQNKQRHI